MGFQARLPIRVGAAVDALTRRNRPHFRFLDLPPELRLMIYEYLVPPPGVHCLDGERCCGKKLKILHYSPQRFHKKPLLYVNRLIYLEFAPLLWKEDIIMIHVTIHDWDTPECGNSVDTIRRKVPKRMAMQIRNIEIERARCRRQPDPSNDPRREEFANAKIKSLMESLRDIFINAETLGVVADAAGYKRWLHECFYPSKGVIKPLCVSLITPDAKFTPDTYWNEMREYDKCVREINATRAKERMGQIFLETRRDAYKFLLSRSLEQQ